MASKNKYVHKIDHNGSAIGFLPTGRFEIEIDSEGGPDFKEYGDVESAKNAIDAREKSRAATNRKKTKLRCVSESGQEYWITGIHAGHGNLILNPPLERYSSEKLLPYTEPLKALTVGIKALQDRANDLTSVISQFRLIKQGGWRREEKVSTENHGQKVDELQARYEEVVALAKKMESQILEWAKGGAIPEKMRHKEMRL